MSTGFSAWNEEERFAVLIRFTSTLLCLTSACLGNFNLVNLMGDRSDLETFSGIH